MRSIAVTRSKFPTHCGRSNECKTAISWRKSVLFHETAFYTSVLIIESTHPHHPTVEPVVLISVIMLEPVIPVSTLPRIRFSYWPPSVIPSRNHRFAPINTHRRREPRPSVNAVVVRLPSGAHLISDRLQYSSTSNPSASKSSTFRVSTFSPSTSAVAPIAASPLFFLNCAGPRSPIRRPARIEMCSSISIT